MITNHAEIAKRDFDQTRNAKFLNILPKNSGMEIKAAELHGQLLPGIHLFIENERVGMLVPKIIDNSCLKNKPFRAETIYVIESKRGKGISWMLWTINIALMSKQNVTKGHFISAWDGESAAWRNTLLGWGFKEAYEINECGKKFLYFDVFGEPESIEKINQFCRDSMNPDKTNRKPDYLRGY